MNKIIALWYISIRVLNETSSSSSSSSLSSCSSFSSSSSWSWSSPPPSSSSSSSSYMAFRRAFRPCSPRCRRFDAVDITRWGYTPTSNPQPGGPGISLCSESGNSKESAVSDFGAEECELNNKHDVISQNATSTISSRENVKSFVQAID